MTRAETFDRVSGTLEEMFQIDPKSINMETRLVEDLDLDSIDAIDLAARLQEYTGKRLAEDDLLGIRTVSDIVNLIERMVSTKA